MWVAVRRCIGAPGTIVDDVRKGRRYTRLLTLLCFVLLFGGQCTLAKSCTAEEFTCSNGVCVGRYQRCNGHTDCGAQDHSDELNCPDTNACHASGGIQCFHSGQMRCWPIQYRCDNLTDCDGGEDERDCSSTDLFSMNQQLSTTAPANTGCQWSKWSDCSLPTCNAQERRPVAMGDGDPDQPGAINCTAEPETRKCTLDECSEAASNSSVRCTIAIACSLALTLLLFGACLELVLRRQFKKRSLMVKSASNQSSQTTGSAVQLDGTGSPQPTSIPMVTMMSRLPAAQSHQQLGNQIGNGSSVQGGSLATAETFLDTSADSDRIAAKHTAEIRRSLRMAMANIERQAESDRCNTTSPSQPETAVAAQRVDKTPDRRALLSSPAPFYASPHQPKEQQQQQPKYKTPTTPSWIYCPMCSTSKYPGESCCAAMQADNGVDCSSTPNHETTLAEMEADHLAVIQITEETPYYLRHLDTMFHQTKEIENDSIEATSVIIDPQWRQISDLQQLDDMDANNTKNYPLFASVPAPSINTEISGQDILLLAAALNNASACGSLYDEHMPPRRLLVSSADERSTCSSSRLSCSQVVMPCNTPVSNQDCHSSSLDDSTSCKRFFRPSHLAVSGAA